MASTTRPAAIAAPFLHQPSASRLRRMEFSDEMPCRAARTRRPTSVFSYSLRMATQSTSLSDFRSAFGRRAGGGVAPFGFGLSAPLAT